MKKITYLFGAGASRHALPIVNEIPDRIKNLIIFLEKGELQLDPEAAFEDLKIPNSKSGGDYQIELIDSLKWMLTASQTHASIDTFAKKLFIKESFKELKKLKIAMSVFFIFEQAINKPDFRYDTFFASLLTTLSEFPENVRILSWNYDYQFELAYAEYSEKHEILANQRILRVKARNGEKRKEDGWGIYKLNGTTGLYSDDGFTQHMYASSLNSMVDKPFVAMVTRSFVAATYLSNIASTLSFAWEEERPEKSIVSQAMEDTKDTVALVIIGYSFPFFNRDVDRKIIGNMENLKRVYFQAPDAETIKERFQAFKDNLTGIELLTKFDVEQFLLPNEL